MSMKIPKSLRTLADFCAKEVVRYSLTGVRVEKNGEKLRVTASDGKKLVDAIIRSDGQKEFAMPDDSESKASFSCIVPLAMWKEAALNSDKDSPNLHLVKINGHVTIKSQKKKIDRIIRAKNIEGNFPNVLEAFPKDKVIFEETFDPLLLGEALIALARTKPHKPLVTLRFFGVDKPLLIIMRSDDADIRALVMPIHPSIKV